MLSENYQNTIDIFVVEAGFDCGFVAVGSSVSENVDWVTLAPERRQNTVEYVHGFLA